MWGIKTGKGGSNLPKIRKMNPGDWAIFSGDKHLYFGGTIALMWQDAPLARRLWGADEDGNTWEHMYALAETRGFDVPIDEVRDTLQWLPKRNIQGVAVLKETEADLLQDLLSLDQTFTPPDRIDHQTQGATSDDVYDSELERTVVRILRAEQAALKRRLLPGDTGQCALCGRTLPKSLLIAAHIKKRAVCTDTEKRDFANIAMPACALGCDALYEQGFITVAPGGGILVSPRTAELPEVAAYVDDRLAGRTITYWTDTRSPYFHWHRTHTFKDNPPA